VADETVKRPLRIGLTGGIASGKSTVADMFAELGVPVIDTDVIAREVVKPGQPALEDIRQKFGEHFIDAAGNLDRAALRKEIFAGDQARSDLEAIVVPLLTESALMAFVDRVLVVDCTEDLQIRRLCARDIETIEQARSILKAQTNREARLASADDVIVNDGSLRDTREAVTQLDREYRRLAQLRDRH
jgi:dephospho-CoA kinase